MPMNSPQVRDRLAKAIEPSSVVIIGKCTRPRSWGVYEIEPPNEAATARFRMGNHPVRQQELAREFGKARLAALFRSRPSALQLAALLNSGWSA